MKWMDLEPVIQSEVSQKEKSKCHILTHIYGSLPDKALGSSCARSQGPQ